MNNLSTLSTEETADVDKENVDKTSEEMEGENEETDTSDTEEGIEEQGEYVETEESEVEIASDNEAESQIEIETDSETESETDPDEISEAASYMDEVLEDAAFYYVYYASIYESVDEDTSLEFDEKSFVVAYKSIKNETLDDYFSDICWLLREEGISLSFTPTELLLPENNKSANLWMARCIHAFELVEEAYSSDENWDHPDSLKPQFHCHAIYARQNKVPWNIEPYRTETSFLKILLASGNPDS